MCCSPVCVLLHGQRNSLYTAKSLSCLSAGYFVLKASMVVLIRAYCWCGLLFLFITPWKGKSVHCYQHKIFSWLMQAVQQVPDLHFPTSLPYLSSPSTVMSHSFFSWLCWGLSFERCLGKTHKFFALTGSWEAVLKLAVSWALYLSGLNYCGVWELWGESVEKTGSSRKAKTDS